MSRLEVLAGPGMLARFGDVCVWSSPAASPTLVAFLVDSARNVGAIAQGGTRIVDHIGAVLAGRDPEPGVGFAAIGPTERGAALLLHGAIQAWDGTRWIVPQPQPGWLRIELGAHMAVTVAAHGAPALAPVTGSDLRQGVVPAAGFVLVPEADDAATRVLQSAPTRAFDPGPTTTLVSPDLAPTTALAPEDPGPTTTLTPERTRPVPTPVGEATVVDTTELMDALRQIRQGRSERDPAAAGPDAIAADVAEAPTTQTAAAEESPTEAVPTEAVPTEAVPTEAVPTEAVPPQESPTEAVPTSGHSAPAGLVDLGGSGPSMAVPLRAVGEPDPPIPGQPVVAGVHCSEGHFNHPNVTTCVICGRRIAPGQGRLSGTRPPLGVLMVDNGDVYRLDGSYLIGTNPGSDPTVTGGRVRALTLDGPPGVASAQVEIRLTGWEVSVIDRGSSAITQVLQPGESTWSQVSPFVSHPLRPGAHVAIESRVVSLISPWPIDTPVN